MKKIINGVVVEVDDKEYMDDYEPTPKEVIIDDLKQKLANTDYKAIKTSEKFLIEVIKVLIELCEKNDVNVEDVKSVVDNYSATELQRQEWRNKINKLEKEGVTDGDS